MAIKLSFGRSMFQKLYRGCELVYRSVGITLGPKGRNVIIKKLRSFPRITNDGVTIARTIFLEDEGEDAGAQLIKMAAEETNARAGDGTTTAVILTFNIFKRGLRKLTRGVSVKSFQSSLEKYATKIVNWVLDSAIKIQPDSELLNRVASISANDKKMGKVIGEALSVAGAEGSIVVEEKSLPGISWRQDKGITLPIGLISGEYFANDVMRRKATYENAPILIIDKRVNNIREVLPVVRKLLERPDTEGGKIDRLVIIADEFDPNALVSFIQNTAEGKFYVLPLVAPGAGDIRTALLHDYASVVGATVISDTKALRMIELDKLGGCDKIESTIKKTVIIGGHGDPSKRVESLREELKETDDEFTQNSVKDRMAALANKIVIIEVGAATQVELQEQRYRIEDAVNATRAALESGVVPGGGVCLKDIRERLKDEKPETREDRYAINVLFESLITPYEQIYYNATGRKVSWFTKLLQKWGWLPSLPKRSGYNAETDEYVEMIESGIMDPAKVVAEEVTNSASIAAALLTMGGMSIEKPRELKEFVQSMKNIMGDR